MDEASAAVDGDDDAAARPASEVAIESEGLGEPTATMLVEVAPGLALVYGEVPEGMDLIDLTGLPERDSAQLFSALGTIGNVCTTIGNTAEHASAAKGLYRLTDASMAVLKSGGKLGAAKDGANVGLIYVEGSLATHAHFIPVSASAASTLAAIGPAIAMFALQQQIGEIAGLVRTNIALTTQVQKSIRNEQWSELEALVEVIGEAVREANELGLIPDSTWEAIAPVAAALRKQLKLYRKNVAEHISELCELDGRDRRQYLESNAEAIVFDTHALLSSLKAHSQHQALRATQARARSVEDEAEARLFERITRVTPPVIEESLAEIRLLTASLVRELRIIAELPGRATVPLTKRRRDARASRLACAQLLRRLSRWPVCWVPPSECRPRQRRFARRTGWISLPTCESCAGTSRTTSDCLASRSHTRLGQTTSRGSPPRSWPSGSTRPGARSSPGKPEQWSRCSRPALSSLSRTAGSSRPLRRRSFAKAS